MIFGDFARFLWPPESDEGKTIDAVMQKGEKIKKILKIFLQ